MQREMQDAQQRMFEHRVLRYTGYDLAEKDESESLLRYLRTRREDATMELVRAEIKLLEFDGQERNARSFSNKKTNARKRHGPRTQFVAWPRPKRVRSHTLVRVSHFIALLE